MHCQFFGRYYYNAIYVRAFYGSDTFPCRSLLLSTTVLNDNNIIIIIIIKKFIKVTVC